MKREEALDTLKAEEQRLRSAGAAALYLFGSVARDEAEPDSDVDILLELPDDTRFSLLDLSAFQDLLVALLQQSVDVVVGDGLRASFRSRIAPDLIKIF